MSLRHLVARGGRGLASMKQVFPIRAAVPHLVATRLTQPLGASSCPRQPVKAASYTAQAPEDLGGGEQDEIPQVDYNPAHANMATLVGRLGKDPQQTSIRVGGDSISIVRTSLAVTRSKAAATDWYSLEMHGRLGELAMEGLRKGDVVRAVGPLRQDSFTDKRTGQPRMSMTLTASKVYKVRRADPSDLQQEDAGGGWAASPAPEAAAPSPSPSFTRPSYGAPSPSFTSPTRQPAPAAPAAAAPAAPPAAAAPAPRPSAAPGDAPLPRPSMNDPASVKWAHWMRHPEQYWDNRNNKRNPKAPDFKHKEDASLVLWVSSRDTPQFVRDELGI